MFDLVSIFDNVLLNLIEFDAEFFIFIVVRIFII